MLDKFASKAIPATRWTTVSGIAMCAQQFLNDVSQDLNNQLNQQGPNPNATADMATCLQNVANGMAKP
jgi:hypothetical protein